MNDQLPPLSPDPRLPRIAICGVPNSGKSSLFNTLLGQRERTGNYPGVTVEIRARATRIQDRELVVVDLPGTGGMVPVSPEEQIAVDFLLGQRPEVVVVLLDAQALERSLYFFSQLMETGLTLVACLNMVDEAEERGWKLSHLDLEQRLKCPVVRTIAPSGEGIEALRDAIIRQLEAPTPCARVPLGRALDTAMRRLIPLAGEVAEAVALPPRFLTTRLLEGDSRLAKTLEGSPAGDHLLEQVTRERARLEQTEGLAPDILLADARFGFAHGLLKECCHHSRPKNRQDLTRKLDQVLMHRQVGLPIFFLMMYGLFTLTFQLGDYPVSWLEQGFNLMSGLVSNHWSPALPDWGRSLLADGIIPGVGGVVVFVPNIMLLFMGISLLENSGYMSRAAFLMDSFMHKIGLHGKSFVPMLLGLGCSVPAIMAARTLENRRDRITTILTIPLVPCGARLPIFLLLIPAFFPLAWRGLILFLVYLAGIAMSLLVARMLRKTILAGDQTPFVMELPPYRRPSLKSVLLVMWDNARLYLKKAGTVVLAMSVLLWILANHPKVELPTEASGVEQQLTSAQARRIQLEGSILGTIGKTIEPALAPIGFDWRISTALLGALAAKEMFVSQLGVVFAMEGDHEEGGLARVLGGHYPPLVGLSILIFMLLTFPCISTMAVTWQETGSLKWVALQFGLLTTLAYLISLAVYTVGNLLT